MSDGAARVELLFLWHHHQPDYRSPQDGRARLPWVRLHATKDYLDMALRLERHARLKATFNFVPSLLDQLADAAGGGRDALFDPLARPVASLTETERAEVALRCGTPPPRMRDRWPQYAELCRRVERLRRGGSIARTITHRELEALEAWFLLAWLDPMFQTEPEAQRALSAKPSPSAADRDALLALHRRLVGEVVPAYRRLAERGQIELSASPYAHPILPLLVSTSSALRARPDLRVPGVAFEAPEDASRQLRRALLRHEQVFGAPPRGLWPSEGSVSPEAVDRIAEVGLDWIGSDEGVLWASLPAQARMRGALYQPWRVPTPHGDVAVFFRDRELSDRIGFVYHHWDAREAVADFLARVRRIGEEHAGARPPVVSVILDGENCWEHYVEDGGPFLDGLYDALDQAADIRTVTPSAVLAARSETPRLDSLHSGSWIDADFHIWIGHPEKNRAWELIARARAELVAAGTTPESHPEAWRALDSAEGSDWFWWLGTDHYTPDKLLFERLLREHLQATFERRGAAVPAWLRVPIATTTPARGPLEPLGFMSPRVDGRVTSYYEWATAGRLKLDAGSAMHRGDAGPSDLYYGFDVQFLYLRLDFAAGAPPGPKVELELELRGASVTRLRVPTLAPGERRLLLVGPEGSAAEPEPGGRVAVGRIVEIAVPLKGAGLEPRAEVGLRLRLKEAGEVVETVPSEDDLTLVVPGVEDEGGFWSVL
jgi:alpha-amylase/alpha-mannosidase (GH57 family)